MRYVPVVALFGAASRFLSALSGLQLLDGMRCLVPRVIWPVDDPLLQRRRLAVFRFQKVRLAGLVERGDVDSLLVELVQILNSSLQFLQPILVDVVLFLQACDVRVELLTFGVVCGRGALLCGTLLPSISVILAARMLARLTYVAFLDFLQMLAAADLLLFTNQVIGVATVSKVPVLGSLVGNEAAVGVGVGDGDLHGALRSLALQQAPIALTPLDPVVDHAPPT